MAEKIIKIKKELIKKLITCQKENIILKKRIKAEANLILQFYEIIIEYYQINETLN